MTATTNVFVPLAGGVKSSRSDRLLGAKSPTLLSVGEGVIQLANGIVDRFWQVIKRPGGVALGSHMLDGTTMPLPWRLAERAGGLISMASYGQASSVQTYSPSRGAWAPADGSARGPTWFKRHRVAAGVNLQSPDLAYLPGYYATAHLDAAGLPVFSLIDEASRLVIYSTTTGTVPCTDVRVVACSGRFCMFYASPVAGTLTVKVRRFVPTDLSSTPITSLFSSAVADQPNVQLDAVKIGADLVKAVWSLARTAIQFADFTPSTGASAVGSLTNGSSNPIASNVLSLVRDLGGSGKVGLLTAENSSTISGGASGMLLHWDITGGTTTATHLLCADASLPPRAALQICGHTRTTNALGDVMAFLEVAGGTDPVRANVRLTGPLGGAYTFLGAGGGGGTALGPNSGVGATLTRTTVGAVSVDGTALALNDRVLVQDLVTGITEKEFGIYKVTTLGTGGVALVLTRATDADGADDLSQDILITVTAGSSNAGNQYLHHPTLDNAYFYWAAGSGANGGGRDVFRPAFDVVAIPDAEITAQSVRWRRQVVAAARNPSIGSSHATWMRGLGISSAPFSLRGKNFLVASYDNTPTDTVLESTIFAGDQPLQSSYYLIEIPSDVATLTTPTLQAHIAVGNGGGIQVISSVPSVAVNAAGEVVAPLRVRNSGQAKSPDRAIEICRLDTTAPLGNHAGAFGSLLIPGGVLAAFDGVRLAPLGFAIFPEPPVVKAIFPVSGGAVGQLGTWRYVHVYRMTDAIGRIYRSAPSEPVDVTSTVDVSIAVADADVRFQVAMTTYRLGDKTITSELYRSAKDVLDVQYLVNDSGPLSSIDTQSGTGGETSAENSVAVDVVTYTDTLSDDELIKHELLYTTGGVLSNDPIPGVSEICLHNGRVFCVSMDDPTQPFYSQSDNGFDGPGFPNTLAIRRPTPVAGLASFAENLILFEGRGVFHISPSTGPDAQGRGLFPDAQASDEGTTTAMPLSICVAPDGVFFRTVNPLDGLQMVNRALQVVPKGLDVQKYSDPVVAACYVPAQGQARFWTAFDPTLVYDPTHDIWSTFTGQGATAATVWNGVPVYSPHGGGPIVQEQAAVYTEAGALYDFDIFSPWFSPLGSDKAATVPNTGGYFLIRDILGIGSGQAGPTLVELRKDFDAATVIASKTGTPGPKFDWVVRGAWKLSCFQVRIRERSATAGPVINGFTVGVAPKRGPNRLAAGKSLRDT